ncbi:NUDIX hydrolase [Flavilitoribacter nigricans]|uniref:DNA mismatch repair protein MutT n=1 Tax=Flavilitoribacter nigricans (strain ATCC 23147 / DSM 23189 / NBRC 102662 / NCIMB 1420 / SS-2) TaxID=1122177 RepID=A0A2D0NJ41_FLAN2|nr:NUDIX domain-containing protein [Flavilitoribacter nigricans]PHN08376.1 DNA mismatch repair protein MutT [Flavilitoribacter nigricans DSM 23189 = NBRC 102662]
MHKYYGDNDKLWLAVDCIVFGFDEEGLKVLLIRRDFEPELGQLSLMGGFVQASEDIDTAAHRVVEKLTGISDIYLEQLQSFGQTDRDPAGRVVSIAYFALINIQDYNTDLGKTHNATWYPAQNVPRLIFDHNQMVEMAKKRLRYKASTKPIGFALLPNKFTIPQLQKLYTAIFETQLDSGNFSRRIHSLGILKRLNEKQRGHSKKGAFYYIFDEDKYRKLEDSGYSFVIK